MPWDYLQNPVLRIRQRIAAELLQDCENILEIGAFKTPVTAFLLHQPKEVVVIDPLVEAYESDELNGRPCTIRHLPIALDEFDLRYWGDRPFGLLFCGMDLNRHETEPGLWLETVCRFLYLVSRSERPVLEYPIHWQPSANLFNLILSLLQPKIAADLRLDLTRYVSDPEMTDEIRSRFYRRMVVLADMTKVGDPMDLRERAARILFGTEAAPFVLGTSSGQLRKVENGLDMPGAKLAYENAQMEIHDGVLSIVTAPDAWSYAVLIPMTEEAIERIPETAAVPAAVEVQIYVGNGEVGLGLVSNDMRKISGERLVKASDELQTVRIFIPDVRGHAGLICRNGQLSETASAVRIVKATLLLPPEQ
jgi:hypothetical protein